MNDMERDLQIEADEFTETPDDVLSSTAGGVDLLKDLSEMSESIPDIEPPVDMDNPRSLEQIAEETKTEYTPGIVAVHWDKFREIEKRFKMIFSLKRQYDMIRRLDILRYDSTTNGEGRHEILPHPTYAPLFYQVEALSKEVVRFCYKDMLVKDDNPEVEDLYKKIFHDMQMILFRHYRENKKRNRHIPLALLTPGTVFEYHVCYMKKPEIMTVKEVNPTELDYGIVICEETRMEHGSPYSGFFPKSEHVTFNSSHITRVIKHANVPLKKEKHREETPSELYSKYEAYPKPGKSKNSYATTGSGDFLVASAIGATSLLNDHCQAIKYGELRHAFFSRGAGLKTRYLPECNWFDFIFIINKKKFKRFVRQNMNRFLILMKEQERLEKEYNDRMMAEYSDPFDDD